MRLFSQISVRVMIFGNFEFSNLFSHIRLKKRHTSFFSGNRREIRTKLVNFKIGCFKIGTEHTAHDDAHVEGPHLALVWDFREWIFPLASCRCFETVKSRCF